MRCTLYIKGMSYTVLELDVTGLQAITAPILCGLAIDSNGVGIPGANVSVNGVVVVQRFSFLFALERFRLHIEATVLPCEKVTTL